MTWRTFQCSVLLAVAALGGVGCSSSDSSTGATGGAATVASCRDQFSPARGYGYQDDLSSTTAPPPDSGLGAPDASTSTTLDHVVAECASGGGTACDPSTFLTHDAALCVAKLSGLADGIAGLKAGIVFHAKYLRVVWNVQNLISGTPGGAQSGDTVTLDAVDGSVLGRGSWGATP